MTTDPRDNLARKVYLAEVAAVNEYLAEQEQASTDKARVLLAPLEAKVRELKAQELARHRAAVLREAAELVAADTGFHIRYGSATDYAERYAALLRRTADEEQADAVASCPGYETSPNPCRCPCYGCKHHCAAHQPADEQAVRACDGCGTPAHPYLNCDQAQQAREASRG